MFGFEGGAAKAAREEAAKMAAAKAREAEIRAHMLVESSKIGKIKTEKVPVDKSNQAFSGLREITLEIDPNEKPLEAKEFDNLDIAYGVPGPETKKVVSGLETVKKGEIKHVPGTVDSRYQGMTGSKDLQSPSGLETDENIKHEAGTSIETFADGRFTPRESRIFSKAEMDEQMKKAQESITTSGGNIFEPDFGDGKEIEVDLEAYDNVFKNRNNPKKDQAA